ncbi:MAG: DUF6288 domain-containing protein [Planctomycetota bacterium]|nr:DUF6288 domain-containing protein [Planctomycetota bacterium]
MDMNREAEPMRARAACGLVLLCAALARGAEPPKVESTEADFQASLKRYCGLLERSPAAAPIPVQLGGWASLQVPSCAVAGLVLLGEGNTPVRGPYAAQLDKLYKYTLLATSSFPVGSPSHESWPLGFGILFLSEIHRLQPSAELRAHIEKLVKRLESGMDGEKGWRHTLQPDPKEDYGAFVGVSIWCVAGLAAAQEQGVAVDELKLRTALAGIRKCVGVYGGAQYFSGQKSLVTPGRSAAILWLLHRYAGEPGAEAERAKASFLRTLEASHEGHGSQMMNFAWAAMGAAVAGAETGKAFWDAQLENLNGARQPDGGLVYRAWPDMGFPDAEHAKKREGRGGSALDKTFIPDRMYGEGWTGAWLLLAWQCGLGRCILVKKPGPAALPALKESKDSKDTGALRAGLDEAAALLAAGKAPEAAPKLDALLRAHPGHAEALKLRGIAALPPLAKPVEKLDAKALAARDSGWSPSAEGQALAYFDRALRAREGKGLVPEAFDAQVRLLAARVHAKRLVLSVAADPRSPAWVPLYNTFVNTLNPVLQSPAAQAEGLQLMQAVQPYLPVKK